MVSSTPLTDDMLLEIFSHLPLNSTYKFKCLSKVWLSNLSHPEFITKWFKINSKSLPWIQYYSTNDHRVTDEHADKNRLIAKMAYPESHSGFMSRNDHLFSLKFLMSQKPSGAELLVLGSSNGLVLCSVILCPRRKKTDGLYHVCNPLTQEWVSLPPYIEGFGVSAIFCEHSSSFPSCFKVVRIREFETPSKKFIVDMFCSTLGVWESFQVSCDKNVVWGWSNKIVTLNGVLFWAEGGGMLVCDLNQKNGSGGRRCSLIDLPDRVLDVNEFGIFDSRIGESEGRVCYAKIKWTASGRGMTVSIWVLNEVKWKILHRNISLDNVLAELLSRIGEEAAPIRVLGFSPVDRNVILLGWKHWVWRLNIKTRSFEELRLDNRRVHDAGVMILPFALKPMPTVLPPPSW